MGERIKAIIDALRSTPEDAFGCVSDTPDQQGWWIRDELIDSACKVREELERLRQELTEANRSRERLRERLDKAYREAEIQTSLRLTVEARLNRLLERLEGEDGDESQ